MQKKKWIKIVVACIIMVSLCITTVLLCINGFGIISNATATKKEMEKIDTLAGMRSDDIIAVNSSEETTETVTDPLHGYAVSTANGYATEVGMQILEQGGNAVDAAIAVAYTLSVVQPEACGLGGGGGMLIYDPETDTYSFIDYREISSSNFNTNICIPGFVAGMDYALEKFGTMELSELLSPAYDYAQNGFVLGDYLAYNMKRYWSTLSKIKGYNANGKALRTGEILIQTDLARVIEIIMEEGSSTFYDGELGVRLATSCKIDPEEWASYSVKEREPVRGTFEGLTVVSAPAPFSGTTLIQMLKMAETIDIADPAKDQDRYLSQIKQIAELAYADRVKKNGDPDFISTQEEERVSDLYIASLLSAGDVAYEEDNESIDTTHFSIIDGNGMVVSNTQTICSFFGSKKCVNGVFMNNAGTHFGSKVNKREAGKRARNFTAPTIVSNEDMMMAIGTPGGNTIPKLLVPILVDTYRNGTSLEDAVKRGRFIFNYNGSIEMEKNAISSWMIDPDQVKTYHIIWSDYINKWGAVEIAGYSKTNGLFTVSDHRRSSEFVKNVLK